MIALARARIARAIEKSAGRDFTSEKQILLDRKLRHQAEFLEYRADADDAGAMRGEVGDLSALIFESAGIRRIRAGDDVDQRRLAGAVFTEQDVNFAAPKVEVDAFQSDDAGKPLRDIGEIEKDIATLAGPLPPARDTSALTATTAVICATVSR